MTDAVDSQDTIATAGVEASQKPSATAGSPTTDGAAGSAQKASAASTADSTTGSNTPSFPINVNVSGLTVALRPWKEGDQKSLVVHANNVKIWRNMRDLFPHPYTQVCFRAL